MQITGTKNKVKVGNLAEVREDEGFRGQKRGKQKSACDYRIGEGT